MTILNIVALAISALLAQSSSAFPEFNLEDMGPMNSSAFLQFNLADMGPMNSTELEEAQAMLDEMKADINMQNVGLFEGDIKLTEEQEVALTQRKVANYAKKWDPKVFYTFSVEGGALERNVQAGIDHWKQHTCIEFEKVAPGYSGNHIKFDHTTRGCWSYLGVVSSKIPQTISLPSYCQRLGTVVHEIGHALGLLHEQSRSDRDEFVTIATTNIHSYYAYNFKKGNTLNFDVPYDYKSIMHYGSTAFSKNGQFTVIAKEAFGQAFVGQRDGLSHMDKLIANNFYGCIKKYMEKCSLNANPCKNHGILQADCSCVCPPGSSGSTCETLSMPYRKALESELKSKAIITEEGSFTSPRIYGYKMPIVIEAPKCNHVRITFTYFYLYSKCGSRCLKYGQLYIMTTPGDVGVLKCSQDIRPGDQFTSVKNKLVLYYESYISGYTSRRFDIDIEFIEDISLECLPTSIPPSLTNAPASIKIHHENAGDCGWYDAQTDGMWVSTLTSPESNIGDCQNVTFKTQGPQFLQVKLLRFYPKDEVTLTLTDFAENTIEFTASDVNKDLIVPAYGMIYYKSKRGQNWPNDFVLQMKPVESPCIVMVNADNSTSGDINKENTKHMCQWWFRIPDGYNFKLDVTSMDIGTAGCSTADFLAIGSPGEAITKYCGDNANKPEPITFTEREIAIYGHAMTDVGSYNIEYSVVAAA